MKRGADGFLLVDAVMAAAVLAVTVGAVAGTLAAQESVRQRAAFRTAAARCFDAALVVVAANPGARRGSCGDIVWTVADGPTGPLWFASDEKLHAVSVPFPPR